MNNKNEVSVLLNMGIYCFDRKEYEKALGLFKRVLELDPFEKSAHFRVGEINYRLGNYDKAVSELKRTLKVAGRNECVYMLLGVLYREKERYEEAIGQLDKALRLSKRDKEFELDVRNEKANVYFLQKKYDLALKEIKKVVELNPGNKYAYKLSGDIYCRSRQYEKALVGLEKALALSKRDKKFESEVCHESAVAYFELKKYGLAVKYAKKAIKLNAHNRYAYKLSGDVYNQCGRYEEALVELEKALVLSKGDKKFKSDICHEKANAYLGLKKYARAIEQAKKAVSLNKDNKYGYSLSGCINLHVGRYEEALSEFRKALKLSCGDKEFKAGIYNDLARIYSEQGRYKEALNEFAKVVDLRRNDKKAEEKIQFEILKLAEHAGLNSGRGKTLELVKKALKLKFTSNTMIMNSLTNELEIAKKAVRLRSKVRKLIVNLTNQCNLDCKMCLNKKTPKQEISGKMKIQIMKAFPYLESINWMGGEAFLYPGFNELIDEAVKYPLKQEITTNALLIDEKTASKLIQNNVKLTISIDGVTKAVYENIRKGAKFASLMQKLKMFDEVIKRTNPGYKMCMNAVVLKSNWRQIEAFTKFAIEHNFGEIGYMIVSGNRNNENIFNFNRDAGVLSSIRKALDNARQVCRKHGIIFNTNITENLLEDSPVESVNMVGTSVTSFGTPIGQSCEKDDVSGKISADIKICRAPWKMLNINMNGEVNPNASCFCSSVVGNLNTQSLDDIWNGEAMVNYRRQIVEGNIEKVCTLKQAYKEIPFELLR